MPTAAEINKFKSLKDRQYRLKYGVFVAETPKVVSDLIDSGMAVEIIYVTNDNFSKWKNKYPDINIESISNKELHRLSFVKSPNEVSAIFKFPSKRNFIQQKITFILDNISDPGNMGTILRTAHWFGIKNIICTEKCVDIFNPKVVQSTMGSLAQVNVYYCSKETIISMLDKSTTIYGSYMEGENVFKVDFKFPLAIVIGNEAHGILELKTIIDKSITIPPADIDNCPDSLNAAVATALLMSVISAK
jgi:TrmH family RNA methyltransferase